MRKRRSKEVEQDKWGQSTRNARLTEEELERSKCRCRTDELTGLMS